MKTSKLAGVVLAIILIIVATVGAAPMLQNNAGELDASQLVIVGIFASIATWLLKVAVSRGWKPKKEYVAIGLYVVSFFVAVGFTQLTLPSFPDYNDAPTWVGSLFIYIGLLVQLASPVVGMAYLIYNVLLERVLNATFLSVKA